MQLKKIILDYIRKDEKNKVYMECAALRIEDLKTQSNKFYLITQ